MIVGGKDNVPYVNSVAPNTLPDMFVEIQECLPQEIEGAKKTLFGRPRNQTLVTVWGLGNSPLGVMRPQETLT